jgi:hypothetical protein
MGVDFLNQHWIGKVFLDNEIYVSFQDLFQCVKQSEIIVRVVQDVHFLELHQKIDIAIWPEMIGQHGAEQVQPGYFVLSAQGSDLIQLRSGQGNRFDLINHIKQI